METRYFTFGFGHKSVKNNIKLDSSTIIEITSNNPRNEMFEMFGSAWAFEYSSLESIKMSSISKVININTLK